ncbi:protein of unknown function [Candidatus Promineifilum breve]|uniref:Uncharacterized protein n=1 Tax=Candidatus Promineifilum breve TaxID=1806508 RepID=A0A160T9L2_9CHLR|nr:protein of unknown function [Candidatus Promineifilum breve]
MMNIMWNREECHDESDAGNMTAEPSPNLSQGEKDQNPAPFAYAQPTPAPCPPHGR